MNNPGYGKMRSLAALLALGLIAGLVWMFGGVGAAPSGKPLEPGSGQESLADGGGASAALDPWIGRTQAVPAARSGVVDGESEPSREPKAGSAAELLDSLGLDPSLIAQLRLGPAGRNGSSGLGGLRQAMIGSGAGQQELYSALGDPEATPQQKSLLLVASIWAQEDSDLSITEIVEPVDFLVLASLEYDDPKMQYEFAKAVTLARLGEPGAADYLLGGLDPQRALTSAQGITAEGHLIQHLLLAATDQDVAALSLARSMTGDGVNGLGDDAAWAAIASVDPAAAVGSALAMNPSARDGLILAAHSMAARGEARSLNPLLSMDATDVASGHFVDRGARAILAGGGADTIDEFFSVMDGASSMKATWMRRGVLAAKSCTALGAVLARTALDPKLSTGPVGAPDLLELARRVEQRLDGGDMSRYEERSTLQSVADRVRTLPVGSEQRKIALSMLSKSMELEDRSLAQELGGSK